jgi:hypothetical protein
LGHGILEAFTVLTLKRGNILSLNGSGQAVASLVEALCCIPRISDLRTHEVIVFYFSIYLILQAAQGPWVYSASKKIDYQKQKNVSGEQRADDA